MLFCSRKLLLLHGILTSPYICFGFGGKTSNFNCSDLENKLRIKNSIPDQISARERMASPGGEEEGGSDRRYRPNMQGLLQFCADSTRSEDAAGSSGAQEMDPEVGRASRSI